MKKEEELFALVKLIPKGRVTTYKILAQKLNLHPRQVAKILRKNKNLVIIPCHRVVYSNGKLGGYVKGKKQKEELLKKEGIKIYKNKIINFKNVIFTFKRRDKNE